MSCSDGVKKEIITHIIDFAKQHEGRNEPQNVRDGFVLGLFQRYGMPCVREVLTEMDAAITIPLN